jgi:hypothetical protein
VPRAFSSRVRETLLAQPASVKLRDKSPFFYEMGLRLAELSRSEDASKLPGAIRATLLTRVAGILAAAQHSRGTDVSRFTATLCDLEQNLFWMGYHYARDRVAWRQLQVAGLSSYAAEAQRAALAGLNSNAAGQKRKRKT